MVARGEFPTREKCDLNDPEEAFLWMFAALPGVRGAPLIMPIEYYRQVSRRLWDLGARPAEEPTLEWVAPTANDPNWLTSPGRWVPAGSIPVPDEEDAARTAVARMAMAQRHELFVALGEWKAGREIPDTPSGRVAGSLTFGQRETALKVLTEDIA